MSKDINIYRNQSLLGAPTKPQNFYPQSCAKITTSSSSASVTFSTTTGTIRQTFFIVNAGTTNGAFISWGVGSATATAVNDTTPVPNTAYISAGMAYVLDTESTAGIVDTIAAIQAGGATDVYVHIGDGQ